MTTSRTLLTTCCVVLLLVAPTEAGILVLDNGETIVGKFGPQDVTDDVISIRTLEGEGRSAMKVPRHRVRWFDHEAFAPTDAYFDAHLEDSLAARWEPLREGYRVRRAAKTDEVDPIVVDTRDLVTSEPLTRLDLGHLVVGSPRGWWNETTDPDEITMCVGKRRESNYAPRIHVFSVEAPRATNFGDQLELVQGELRKLAAEGGYRTEELFHLKKRPDGGADQVMITVTRGADGREIRALRKICFRAERTYFFAAYADARDFEAEEGRFWASLESFEPKEDQRKP